jgi:myosin heavy subunit
MNQAPARQLSETLDPWSVVNHRLKKYGYPTIDVTTADVGFMLKERTSILDNLSSVSLRSTILGMLDDLERKEAVMQNVLAQSQSKSTMVNHTDSISQELEGKKKELDEMNQKLGQISSLCVSLEDKCRKQEAELNVLRVQKTALSGGTQSGETKKDKSSLAETLRGRIAELEYANAKLKLDLQNRPERKEWKECQKRMKEVETELEESRHTLTIQQVKCAQLTKDLESVFSGGEVSNVEGVLEVFSSYRQKKDACCRMEKFISTVCEVVSDPTAPRPPTQMVAMTPPHKPWCHVTWSHVLPTLNYWLKQFEGLKELYSVLCDVAGEKMEKDDIPVLSCSDLANILKHWLLKKHHSKLVKDQALPGMVSYIQQLFSIRDKSGVYPKMNEVYSQLHTYRNMMHAIQSQLNLESCSPSSLVLHMERLSSAQNGNFWLRVRKEFGYNSAEEVLARLACAEEFLPAFQDVVKELQSYLGVTSLVAITPTLKTRLGS